MAKVVLPGSLRQFTGGATEFELDVATIQQLLRVLGQRFPAIKPQLAEGFAVAIDGQIFQDALLEPIGPDSEVYLVPPIGGGRPGPSLRGGRRPTRQSRMVPV